ncbi:MAG: hypothetical protein ACK47B_01970 [Armatimonadota bacterium]
MLPRLRTFLIGLALVLGYFWTGAAAKLLLLSSGGGGLPHGSDLRVRPMRGYTVTAANRAMGNLMSVYGPLPMPAAFGAGVAAHLRGVGVGLDAAQPDYDEKRREALERSVAAPGWHPFRSHARLELAALELYPSPIGFSEGLADVGRSDRGAWVTVGMVDADRWWIARQATGPNPPRAEELYTAVIAARPGPLLSGEALWMRALAAAERWDFARSEADFRELVIASPQSPLAHLALQQLQATPPGRRSAADLVPLYRHVLRHREGVERARLAPDLAGLLQMTGDQDAARKVLRDALAELDRLQADGKLRDADLELQRNLGEALQRLETEKPAPFFPPPVEAAPGPRAPVRSRVLANGKPLAGVIAALVPVPDALRGLPVEVQNEAAAPRPAGAPPIPRDANEAQRAHSWFTQGVASWLRTRPELVTRSGADGALSWPSIPSGAYAVFLRAGTWQLPDGGKALAPVPLSEPVQVAGAEVKLPDLRLVTPPEVRPPSAADPTLRWTRVPGAAAYRVSLAARLLDFSPQQVDDTGSGSAAIDPEVAWWRDGIHGASTPLSAEAFVGPAEDPLRSGLAAGWQYTCRVEAFDAGGKLLAQSETLTPRDGFSGWGWRALAGTKKGAAGEPPAAQRFASMAEIVGGADEFGSPFLQMITREEVQPQPRKPRSIPVMAALKSNGQGLPPRRPLGGLPPPHAMPPPGGPGGPMLAGVPPGMVPPGMVAPPGMPLPGGPPPGATMGPGGPFGPGGPGSPGMTAPVLPGPDGRPPVVAAPPPPAPAPAPEPLTVSLVELSGPDVETWQTADGEPVEPAEGALPLRGTLRPSGGAIPLPAGSRRLLARTAGAGAVIFVLHDRNGQSKRLKAGDPVPPGEWSLAEITAKPRDGALIRLVRAAVEVAPGTGIHLTARRVEGFVVLRLRSLASEPLRAELWGGAEAPLGEVELSPRGSTRLRLPLSLFPQGPPERLEARWEGGRAEAALRPRDEE